MLQLNERNSVAGQGIGHVDVHHLASVRLTAGSSVRRRDKCCAAFASHLRVATLPPTEPAAIPERQRVPFAEVPLLGGS